LIRINLLPPEYAAAQAKKEQQLILGTVAGVLVVFLFLFWFIQSRRAARLERQIEEADAELRKFQAIISQIETIENSKKQLLAKRDVIRNLNRSRLIYPVFFEDMLPIIPSDVWVTNVQIQESGTAMKVVMASNALSNFALATWLTNLQQSTHFTNVELSPISYANNDQGGQTLTFSITCSYQHQGPFPLQEFN
jgi:type IV pilus assembly protein PilN